MSDTNDMALVREYAAANSEPAFEALVRRHVSLVYSVALRQVGNPAQAEEITQVVFLILARKAARLRPDTVLAAWLHETARFASASFLRGEMRRRHREQEACVQSQLQEPTADPAWEQLAHLLDEAIGQLGSADRNAVVLRFFQNKSAREIAAALNVHESAAQKRLSRAVEKLRAYFLKRGVAVSTGALIGALTVNSVHGAPAYLAASVVAASAKGAAVSGSTITLIQGALKIMAWTKAKTAIVVGASVLFAVGTATVTVKIIQEQHRYPWQVRNFDSRVLDKVPPQVAIVATLFPDSESWGSANGKFLGSGASIRDILRTTYDKSLARTVVSTELPPGKYDYIANLPEGSAEALQKEIQRQFRVVGRREMRETNVLRLVVKSRNAPGLHLSTSRPDSSLSNNRNHFSCVNLPLTGLVAYLEYYLGIPVVDQPGSPTVSTSISN